MKVYFFSKNKVKPSSRASLCREVKNPKRPVLIPKIGILESRTTVTDLNRVPSPPIENKKSISSFKTLLSLK